ncbi:MAG TPA: TIGR04372 family glycosyltransferase [Rhodocyclaceae bacterium]|nr:TIGR04372 family glycosyltransferase [Rhodocyclaceae bacterium]
MLNLPQLPHGVAYEWRRLRRQGLIKLPRKIAFHVFSIALWLFLLPITFILHLAGYRRVTIFTDRIGHLALEPDCLLKEQALGLIPKRKWFMLAPPERVANQHLLNYWRPLLRVHENKTTCFILASMSRWKLMRYDISHYILAINKAQAAYRIYACWGARAPLLALTQSNNDFGIQSLHELGLPNNTWFVCVHVREAGFSPVDEELHAHRNGAIEALIPAIEEIVKRGGWVIRLGDPSMKPLSALPQCIDYAHHPMKSERLDVVLCAKARFILGNTSGIALVGSAFGTPCALANMIPFSALGLGPEDISIPKLLWSETLSRYLTCQEILNSSIANFANAKRYEEIGIKVVDNSSEDIRLLVLDMIENLNIGFRSTETKNSVGLKLAASHYGYESIAILSPRFIGSHPELQMSLE